MAEAGSMGSERVFSESVVVFGGEDEGVVHEGVQGRQELVCAEGCVVSDWQMIVVGGGEGVSGFEYAADCDFAFRLALVGCVDFEGGGGG